MNGRIRNHSSKVLWVVVSQKRSLKAHLLAPNQQSPAVIDVDAVRAVDGTPIEGYSDWVRIRDISRADVYDTKNALKINCFTCSPDEERVFNMITYDYSPKWGVAL
ncbi:hypothetical protein GCM10023189_32040 [Nibrella saemangeumensis]|uniref:Uncharacterized protein n=2 Tax=Nibrella saemangeumensis TaxID=1084526 RepID=A0ABP8N1S8_9BACT